MSLNSSEETQQQKQTKKENPTPTHYLWLCSLKLIYHVPHVTFDIHSKAMHGDVQEIARLSNISLPDLKEASYHARQHPSSGKVIFKLKTHNLRPLHVQQYWH